MPRRQSENIYLNGHSKKKKQKKKNGEKFKASAENRFLGLHSFICQTSTIAFLFDCLFSDVYQNLSHNTTRIKTIEMSLYTHTY